ncbi:MAG: ketol-acid reductoisomerase [Candidatus Sulfotelmatobacter sp.]
MSTVYHDKDANIEVLKGKIVGVVGYGNQGRPQALNLRDSGINVIIGCIPDSYRETAKRDGHTVLGIEEAVQKSDIVVIAVPDEVQPAVYKASIEKHLRPGMTLCFPSGYCIHFAQIVPPNDVDVVMLAPRLMGIAVRETFLQGRGSSAEAGVAQDFSGQAWQTMLALAKGMGCTRAGVFKSSFSEETEIDLFCEQAVWPAILDCLITAFEVLVEHGHAPEDVAFELYASGEASHTFGEMATQGIFEQMKHHSVTSQYGTLSRRKGGAGEGLRARMETALKKIRDGSFAREWTQEAAKGYPTLNKLRRELADHSLAEADRSARRLASYPFEKQSR